MNKFQREGIEGGVEGGGIMELLGKVGKVWKYLEVNIGLILFRSHRSTTQKYFARTAVSEGGVEGRGGRKRRREGRL